jgi:TRAP-type C4-dicarboxylate transport system permease small subunit
MLKAIVRLFNLIHIGMVYIAKVMIVAMVLITFLNVVLRYGFRSGIVWSEEVALLLAVWFIFIAMGLGVKQGLHINISLFDAAKIPAWFDRGLHRLRDLIVIVVGFVMLRYGWDLVQFTMKSIMPATKWPTGYLYAVLPVSAVVILYEGLTNFFDIDTDDEAVDSFLAGKGETHD